MFPKRAKLRHQEKSQFFFSAVHHSGTDDGGARRITLRMGQKWNGGKRPNHLGAYSLPSFSCFYSLRAASSAVHCTPSSILASTIFKFSPTARYHFPFCTQPPCSTNFQLQQPLNNIVGSNERCSDAQGQCSGDYCGGTLMEVLLIQ